MRWAVVVVLLLAASSGAAEAVSCSNVDKKSALSRLSTAIQFKTVSSSTADNHIPAESVQHFDAFQAWLPTAYPDIWSSLVVQQLAGDGRSYLIRWPGSNPQLPAVLMISHYDVVPVTDTTVKDWTHPPFSGAIADGYIWGRGTMDVKGGALGLLEALTALLQQGYQPTRTLLVALGHDEEVGGHGAQATAAELKRQGIDIDLIWDEGALVMSEGISERLNTPVALVATAEKVTVDAEYEFTAIGGHSSMPPTDGSGITTFLAQLLSHLAWRWPRVQLVSPALEFLQELSPITPWPVGPIVKALTHWGPTRQLLAHAMSMGGEKMACQVRMTVSPTIIQAGVALNVLPQHAVVKVNARLLPGQTQEDLVKYMQSSVAGIPTSRVTTRLFKSVTLPQRPVADHKSVYFQLLKGAIQDVWGPLPVLPTLVCGGTDSRHYIHLSRHGVFRFLPISLALSTRDLHRFHSTDERLSVVDHQKMVCTYIKGMAAFGNLAEQGNGGNSSPGTGKQAKGSAHGASHQEL